MQPRRVTVDNWEEATKIKEEWQRYRKYSIFVECARGFGLAKEVVVFSFYIGSLTDWTQMQFIYDCLGPALRSSDVRQSEEAWTREEMGHRCRELHPAASLENARQHCQGTGQAAQSHATDG